MKETMQKKLLIVDDEQSILDSLTRALNGQGYELLTSPDPLKALELVKTETPPVVITDLKMPGMDGLCMSEKIHEIDPEVPVIVITAFEPMDYLVRAALIGIEKALVVLRGGERQHVLAVDHDDETGFLAFQKFFDHQLRAGVAENLVHHDVVDGGHVLDRVEVHAAVRVGHAASFVLRRATAAGFPAAFAFGSAAAFADHLRVIWLTPAMDQLFVGPASERRRFLDRLVRALAAAN